MGKEIGSQVQEVQRVPYRINPRGNTPRHILIKLSKMKYKENILKAARGKQQITYKGIPIRLTADLSASQKGVAGHIKSDERKKPTTKITLPSKDLIQIRWRNYNFTDKQKLREFSTTKPALQQMLKELP